jgi:galactokinase
VGDNGRAEAVSDGRTAPDGGGQAAELFRQTFDHWPTGLWAAPGRVNLIGEHTDYNRGLVLPIALPRRTWAAAAGRSDGLVRLVSDQGGAVVEVEAATIAPGRPADWARYPAGVVWALERVGWTVGGLDVAFASDLPIGAGLSSSAAIEGAMAAACSDLCGLGLLADDTGRQQLAQICQQAENDIALAPTGGMDQAASLRALPGHALGLDCADQSVEHVPFDLDPAQLVLLIIDTKVHHALGDGQYGARRADCERAVRELGLDSLRDLALADLDQTLPRLSSQRLRRRTRHVVTEIERVRQAKAALAAADFTGLGRLFNASHQSMRHDYEISCPELDQAQEQALAAGALGARMTGGGFGGSAIALIAAQRAQAAAEAVTAAFAARGWVAPGFITARAAGPAERVG